MQPEYSQPTFAGQPEPPSSNSRKKLIIIIGVGVVLLLAIVSAVFLMSGDSKKSNNKTEEQPKNTGTTVLFGNAKDAVQYAGNAVYDACNLMPINILKTHIEKYDELFNSMSSDRHLKNGLVIDHGYIDRNISATLGKDGVAREPSKTVSETGVDSTVRAESFMSIVDSHCTYAQGATFGSEFADVYVIQPPQPLHPQLVAYLNELKQKGKMAIESQGVQVYLEPVRTGDTSYTAIFKKGNTVVFLSSAQQALIQAASDEIVKTLAQAPTGPANITYPAFYSQLKDSCALFPANDFERLMSKPSSSLASETWAITESEEDTAMRECTRIEVERTGQSEISTTRVSLSESRTEDQTKNRLTVIKNDEDSTVTPLKDLGDEAYAIRDVTTANPRYSIVIRVGKVLIAVDSTGETKDATTDAFLSRTLPVAQTVLANFKK